MKINKLWRGILLAAGVLMLVVSQIGADSQAYTGCGQTVNRDGGGALATIAECTGEALQLPTAQPGFVTPKPAQITIEANTELQPRVFLPLVMVPAPWVDTSSREAVRDFYWGTYMASEGVSADWNGNHAECNQGSTSVAFKNAVLMRINYFRSMAGVPALKGFRADYNQLAQSAALMMSVNQQLSHNPPSTWKCYSNDGYNGASSSNLFLGVYGYSAITGYMSDPGSGNYSLGHRRWILYPQTQYMGTGDIPPQNGYYASNALRVFDEDNMWSARPRTREEFVAWPPAGYVPRQMVFQRWSFSYAYADFSHASITVLRDSQNVGVTVMPVVNGYGENTIVWELNEQIPSRDVTYTISIQNVTIDATTKNFSYKVIIFEP